VAADGAGIARLVPKKSVNDKDRWSLFNEEDGIMDLHATDLAVDSSGHIWAAHKGGLSHFTLRKWEQVQFAGNTVNSISVDQRGAIWIATDKGVWRHLPDYATASGRKAELERGAAEEEAAVKKNDEWTHFHSGNARRATTSGSAPRRAWNSTRTPTTSSPPSTKSCCRF
jgi:ligand-binding sensor domain-containing protein